MKPFRWSIAKREQLGRLLDDTAPPDIEAYGFLDELRRVSARMLALGDNSGYAFIGRTPENLFDYLSGVSDGAQDMPALHLVQFSLRWINMAGVEGIPSDARQSYFDYLNEEGIGPAAIATGPRRLTLVDFVARGGTMESFITLLRHQADREGVDWTAVQRKLGIIGLRARTHNSPNTWRWQQHQDWLDIIPDTKISNISMLPNIIYALANVQPKTTTSYYPRRWAEPEKTRPHITPDRLFALSLAAALYDAGRTRAERVRLSDAIAAQPEMRHAHTRMLVSRLRGH